MSARLTNLFALLHNPYHQLAFAGVSIPDCMLVCARMLLENNQFVQARGSSKPSSASRSAARKPATSNPSAPQPPPPSPAPLPDAGVWVPLIPEPTREQIYFRHPALPGAGQARSPGHRPRPQAGRSRPPTHPPRGRSRRPRLLAGFGAAPQYFYPRPMPPPLLALTDIVLSLGSTRLLDGAALAVAQGERLCLVGRNGSGKSTLLKIAAGLVAYDGGVRFLQPGTTVRYLPQEPDLSGPRHCPRLRRSRPRGRGPASDPGPSRRPLPDRRRAPRPSLRRPGQARRPRARHRSQPRPPPPRRTDQPSRPARHRVARSRARRLPLRARPDQP